MSAFRQQSQSVASTTNALNRQSQGTGSRMMEVPVHRRHISRSAEVLSVLERCLLRYDMDGDGVVSAEEWLEASGTKECFDRMDRPHPKPKPKPKPEAKPEAKPNPNPNPKPKPNPKYDCMIILTSLRILLN